ncbi:MAG: hypothetical protein HQM12_17890 [SAR324 cluster bacterium]|nr:hypothetical protein [SAR324 cluster bacterium]
MEQWRFVKIFSVYGGPVYMHWSTSLMVLGSLLVVPFLPEISVLIWCLLPIMILHEMGHAWVTHRLGLEVQYIELYPLHGQCVFEDPGYRKELYQIAWGGIGAQLLLLWVTLPVFLGFRWLGLENFIGGLAALLTVINLFILLLNLFPAPGLDGALCWKLLPLLWNERQDHHPPSSTSTVRKKKKKRNHLRVIK